MADTTVKVSFIGDAKSLSKTLDGVDKDIDNLGKTSKSFGSKFTSGLSAALPVLGAATAAVGLLGGALKAAAEDEAEQKKLASTMMNVASATAANVANTEKWIDAQQRASGIADSKLRPALDILIRGTKDLDASTELLTLAMDISTGTGKDLETVSTALSAAFAGNMRGLQALSPEMKGLIKDGMTADEAFGHLSATFKDQTAIHAGTLEGKMARLKISLDEAMESLGMKLMPVAIDFTTWLTDKAIPKIEEVAGQVDEWWTKQDGLKQGLRDAGEQMKDFIEDTKTLVGWIKEAVEWTDRLTSAITSLPGGDVSISDMTEKLPGKNPATHGLIEIIRGKAAGGPVKAGMPYVVGEKGPELFIPGHSGSIMANGSRAASGSGAPTTIQLNIDGRSFMSWLVDYTRDAGGIPLTTRAPS